MSNILDTFQANKKKPEILLRLFITTAFISITVILLLTGLSIHWIYAKHIINNAEEDAVKISKALLVEEEELLISALSAGLPLLAVEKSGPVLFDRHIRKFLQPFDIVKIKIYNVESRVIYSTDPAIIGKFDPDNKRLKRALLGDNDSKLEKKNKVIDLAGEQRFDVDVVETYVPVRDAAGKVTGSFEVYINVTKYRAEIRNVVAMSISVLALILFIVFAFSFLIVRRGTLQLKEAQMELLRREKLAMLGIVAGNVGNELRNPLGVMSNAVFFLESQLGAADQSVREYLEIIRKEIDGSQRVLSDFVDFFRAASPRAQEFPIEELIKQSLAGCALPESVRVSVELPEALPVIKVDPSQIRQVLRNLITNALQAMPQGGELRIGAHRADRAAGGAGFAIAGAHAGSPPPESAALVEISVADCGAGISPENLGRIFLPLFSTKARGIGLGLSICKSLVEANGGVIEVTSEPGRGACFTVRFPVGPGCS